MSPNTPLKLSLLLFLLWPGLALCQVSVLTQHNDNSRTGLNAHETLLTPTSVSFKTFGKLFTQSVDGFVVAQPLYLPGVTIAGGTHNVVYVATQHDSVYAFDADSNTGANSSPLWSVSFINPPTVTTETIKQQGCPATGYSEIGIMGTPVIDPNTNTLYVVAKTAESGSYILRLHALDVSNGQEKFGGPVVITATYNKIKFPPNQQAQRPGLLLMNGTLYIGFGSNGCDFTAHGWVMSYNPATLQQTGVINLSPNQTYGASVWQAGAGLGGDNAGNVFLMTANGPFEAGGPDFGDTMMKLSLGAGGNPLGWSDYFTPSDQDYLDTHDVDLGSGGPLLLPDQAGPNLHVMLGVGKEGTIYVVNRDNMGQYNGQDMVIQEIASGFGEYAGTPAYWNNMVYFAPNFSPVQAYSVNSGRLSSSPVAQTYSIAARGMLSVSANGTSAGLLWILRGATYSAPLLTAFNATTLLQAYSSNQAADNRDTMPAIAHFATPTIANGKVYAGGQSQVAVYGLLPNLKIWLGNNQSGKVGTTLPKAIQVKAVNPYTNLAIPGVTVTFSDGGAGGTFSSPSAVTNSNGVASTTYTLPSTTGSITITANASGFTTPAFSETATP